MEPHRQFRIRCEPSRVSHVAGMHTQRTASLLTRLLAVAQGSSSYGWTVTDAVARRKFRSRGGGGGRGRRGPRRPTTSKGSGAIATRPRPRCHPAHRHASSVPCPGSKVNWALPRTGRFNVCPPLAAAAPPLAGMSLPLTSAPVYSHTPPDPTAATNQWLPTHPASSREAAVACSRHTT